ncbi:hypothetical protein ACF0H5_008621 [Mactra antiquata]
MEGFNPLDLLASAAELQQKNDDGPERIIITRQRRTAVNSKSGSSTEQKENRELSKNNNNYISKGKPSVVIVKKLKKVEVNPELEKMLDEHNYGNARRAVNHEHSYGHVKRMKSVESGVEIHSQSLNRSETVKSDELCSDLSVSTHTVTTITGGQSCIDKVATVISNTSCSQPCDSECIKLGKCTVECSDKGTCTHECVNRICLCSCKHENTEKKHSNFVEKSYICDTIKNTESRLIDQCEHTAVIGQSGDNCTDKLVTKHDNEEDKNEITTDSVKQSTCRDDNLKLDEHTGEFITKQGERISLTSTNKDKTEVNSMKISTVINKKVPVSIDCGTVENDSITKVQPLEPVKNESISTMLDTKNCTSKKTPYVKVLPSEVMSETIVDKTRQTLVINISGGKNNRDLLLSEDGGTSCKQQLQTSDVMNKSDNSSLNTEIIQSLIPSECKKNICDSDSRKKSVVLSLITKTSKLEMPHCSSHRLGETSDSCSSFKELEFTDSVCAEDSSSSVHLLSPDRRNPDSMGIVESPLTQTVNETSNSGKFEDSFGGGYDNLMDTDNDATPFDSEHVEIEPHYKSTKTEVSTSDNVECTSLLSVTSHTSSAPDTDVSTIESVSDSREIIESNLLPHELPVQCENSANELEMPSTSGTEAPVFRFDSDHCYAGMPRTDNNPTNVSVENESTLPVEGEEASTPLGSTSELSQDSGYEDVTQSPEVEQPVRTVDGEPQDKSQGMKNLVPVLVSVNSNGSLTVHDTDLTKTLSRQVFLPESMKVISGSNITPISQSPLLLSPVTVGKTSQVNMEVPKLVQPRPESILELLSPKGAEVKSTIPETQDSPPLTFGTFKIGTFASFSNTGMGIDPSKKVVPLVKQVSEEKPRKISPSNRSRSNSGKSGKSSPVVDTLGTLVQKVKSSLSPASSVDWTGVDHLQHDHDYCTKNLMPSVVNSFLEARLLSKDTPKSKVSHSKSKRSELDSMKSEGKSVKRKKITTIPKDYNDDLDIDSESDTLSIPEPVKQKYRVDKFIEPKRTDPKVKITGSSNFQDQFVYFMNTKKRSRRRESKDAPLPVGSERVFIPPKPGDIIVPHLTDQDIENLKIRSKQSKQPSANAGYNSLRNEFMAAKLANGTFSTAQPAETVDDEKNIINTILSLENEDLSSPVPTAESPVFNESMEMYGQGLGTDIMNLLPEQMNLTQEQMDLLYSAVDEVQNSSPGLIGTDKLVNPSEAANQAFQFPLTPFVDSTSTTESTTVSSEVVSQADDKQEEPKLLESDVEVKDDSKQIDSDVKYEESHKDQNDMVTTDSVKPVCEVADDTIPSDDKVEKTDNVDIDNSEPKTEEIVNDSVVSDIPSDTVKSAPLISDESSITTEPTTTNSGSYSLSSPVESYNNVTAPVSDKDIVDNVDSIEDTSTDKPLFSTSSISSGLATPSSFGSELPSVSSTPISSEISIDKSLDLLGNIRFDRSDLFSESSVPSNSVPPSPASTVPPPSQVDYNAPWIVTVSMYWNDLPAIMINNQPFVRLVDIHKQILPAKDTGILKKRCQLMGIEVENCSEMQRYFLVQYGKAINSKSTLIISKDNAKVLIGYYVEPQPKAARTDDHHKSIIDHRREQLRRIALARRAAVRAQRLSEKKDEPDPREIKEPVVEEHVELPLKSEPELAKSVEVPVVTSVQTVPHNTIPTDTTRSQRSTRHKKINFLEMLRGDTASQSTEEINDDTKKSHHKVHHDTNENKKKSAVKERKVKIVKYSIEIDSGEETESVESDYSSEYCETDTSIETDHPIIQNIKQPKVPPKLVTKIKSKIKPSTKPYSNKPPLKLKLGLKRPKPATSTPIPVQLVSKGTGTAGQIYRSKMSNKVRNFEVLKNTAQQSTVGLKVAKNLNINLKNADKIPVSASECSTSTVDNVGYENVSELKINSDMIIKSFRPEIADTHELKVSPTLPEDILQTGDSTDSIESEDTTNAPNTDSVNANVSIVDSNSVECDKKLKLSNGEASLIGETPANIVNKSDNDKMSHKLEETNQSISVLNQKVIAQSGSDELSIRIVHRDSSPLSEQRSRSQLGEVFVGRYHNKKSMCVRCYTCRKLMSVDNFLRHLHDVSGGLVTVNSPQTIDPGAGDLNEPEQKLWESFQRKKELFDNNQLPSPDIVKHNIGYDVESQTNGVASDLEKVNVDKKSDGPRIINTPISPLKKGKVVRKNKMITLTKSNTNGNKVVVSKKPACVITEAQEGVRTSSRKRKVKHLDGFEDYSFSKFPRLMKNAVLEEEST